MSKRFAAIFALLCLVVVGISALPAVAYSTTPAHVTIDGRAVIFEDQHPIIYNDRVLVPVRGVFEDLGFDVVWNPQMQVVTMSNRNFTIIVTIGSNMFTVNGERQLLDAPAQIIGERTMLPIRAILESADFIVHWNNTTRTVEITTPRVGHWDNITISGGDLFTANTIEALEIIRNGPPDIYALVMRYIGAIEQGSHSGMWFRRTPPTFVVARRTYDSSPTWYASAIVHDAVHSMQYQRHLVTYGAPVPREVYFGMDAEMEALEIQIYFLIAIDAPQYQIDHAKSMRGTVWWEELPSW